MTDPVPAAGPAAAAGSAASGETFAVKAKIFAAGLVDIAIDLVLPTVVYLALAPTGRSAAVRLSVGGFWVAAKSVSGRVRETAPESADSADATSSTDTAERRNLMPLVLAVLVALASSAATLGAAFAGAGDTTAIVAGTLVLAVTSVPILLRRSGIDGFALLVLAEVAISVILVLISSDPRFILARPAFYTAIAGIYAIITGWSSQPFMMEVSRPMAAGGDPRRGAAFDRAWFSSATFRRTERAMTFGLGAVLLAEAVLRVVVVYTQPRDAVVHASLLSQLPSVVLFVGYLIVIRVFAVPVASREVDREMLAQPTDDVQGA